MKVLIVGKGGREHALAHAIKKSPLLEQLYLAPGNPGTARLGRNLPVPPGTDFVELARRHRIDLVVIGPEAPLAEGLVDRLREAGISAFGPTAAAARLESSKIFAKSLMKKFGIPTARSLAAESYDQAREALVRSRFPLVIKADGLAAGKGVEICHDLEHGLETLKSFMVEGKHGQSGARVLIEEKLEGPELSVLAVTDGMALVVFPPARDHKTIFDRGRGPNTGGMGASSPVPGVSESVLRSIERDVLVQALHAMRASGAPFSGVLYAGLMLTRSGPKVLEFNVRFGDPEAQVLLPRLKSDLLPLLKMAAEGDLSQYSPEFDERAAVCVVLASNGYPGPYTTGIVVPDEEPEACTVYHAGTAEVEGKLVTAGGRVVGVTALGESLAEARRQAYLGVEKVAFSGCHYRTDIGRTGTRSP